MERSLLFFHCLLLTSFPAPAQSSTAETEGRQWAQQILEQRPTEGSSFRGVLRIRDAKHHRTEVPVQFQIVATATHWQSIYETPGTNQIAPERLVVTHDGTNASQYELNGAPLPASQADVAFAGSDFWLSDLGLEFFHWPAQRVVKKELRSSRSCVVLESTNPDPRPGHYARVVTWIDEENDGIIHAEAYDAGKNLMKEFDPKKVKKVNGQWQLQEVEMTNDQTGSRTWMEFDLGGE